MLSKWLCVSFSALMLSMALIFPAYCAPFVFLFLIPLIHSDSRDGLELKDGFLWGVIFFTIVLFPVTMIIYEQGHGKYRLIAAVLLVCASSLYSAGWFLLVRLMSRWLPAYKECIFILISCGYFLVIEQYLFWFFQPTIGYALISPLVPLVHNPCWLQGASFFNVHILLFLILLINWSVWKAVCKKRGRYFFYTLILIIPFVGGWFGRCSLTIPEFITKIGYMRPVTNGKPADMAANLATSLERGLRAREYSLVVMPESSFPYPLNQHDEAVSCWGRALQKASLIIGSHRKETHLHNTLYCVQGGRLTYYYDKKLLVPFTEKAPEGKLFNLFKGLFLTEAAQFYPGFKKKCECLAFEEGLVFKPLICSELFLRNLEQCEQHPKAFYLCIANESWFSIAWQKKLMINAAKLQALRAGAGILYVDHSLGLWITPEGEAYHLKSL